MRRAASRADNEGIALKDRIRAFTVHFLLTAVALAPLLVAVRYFWYPGAYFQLQGIAPLLWILVLACLAAGPLLTLVVFRQGKRGLRFDLSVLVVLQLLVLAFGLRTLFAERPYFMVFALDRFNVLALPDVELSADAGERWLEKPLRGPRYIVANMPMGEAFRKLQNEVIFQGRPDLERRPEFWSSFEDGKPAVRGGARPLEDLLATVPGISDRLAPVLADHSLEPGQLLFAPVVGKRRDMMALVDGASGDLVEIVPVDVYRIRAAAAGAATEENRGR